MNVKTSTWFYGFASIHKAEPQNPNQLSFTVLNVRHSLFLLTTTQYGHYIVKVSEKCDLSTCAGNCVFAVTMKLLFFPYSTSFFSVRRPKTQQVAGVSTRTRLAVEVKEILRAPFEIKWLVNYAC